MNILIIGSSGFIGKACVDYFLSSGYHVSGTDIVGKNENDFIFYQLDSSAPDFNAVFDKTQFDLCINASGAASVAFSMQFPAEDYRMNVTNVSLILDAIVKHQQSCRFINFSSAAVYGNPNQLPIAENAPLVPVSPYGKNKLEAENLIRQYFDRTGLKSCSLRVFSAYGPGLHKQLFWDIYQKSLQTKNIILYGTGAETRDFIFINDLVRAIECIAQNAQMKGECINVASGEETFIRDAARIFLSFQLSNFELKFSGKAKVGDPINWKANNSLLKSLGFVPTVSIADGLRLTADAYIAVK